MDEGGELSSELNSITNLMKLIQNNMKRKKTKEGRQWSSVVFFVHYLTHYNSKAVDLHEYS